MGIFTDSAGNKVGFRGSMNETFKGLSSDGNIESIDVFPNWLDSRDAERVDNAACFFEKLWAATVPGIIVYNFPDTPKEILRDEQMFLNAFYRKCWWHKTASAYNRTLSAILANGKKAG